jgi:uncharacterized membrane protein YesL
MNPFGIIAFALRRSWDEWISVILISALWLLAQVLVIPGPPATATLFAMARRTYDGEYWSAKDAWAAFKALFAPAWLWALPNIAVIGLALYNISTFWNLPGGVWGGLRVVWLVGLLVWLALNLFYWPFWLAAADQSLRNTYANCFRFWLLHPGPAFVLFLVCLIAGAVSLPFALPLVLGVMFLIALIAETAVRRSLEELNTDRTQI